MQSPSDPSSSQPPRVGHARAVRHLLCRAQWREAARLAQQAHLRNSALAGVQAALTTVVVLPLVLISPWPHLVGPASLGALVALFARFAPPSERLPRLAVCLLLQLGAVFVTTLLSALGASDAVLLAWLAASCGLYLYLGMSLRVGPPGPLIFVFAVGACLGSGAEFADVIQRSLATLLAALAAILVCVATERFRPTATAERPLPTEPLLPVRLRLVAAMRAFVASALAVVVAVMLGAEHPAWAAMGALAVMQGAGLDIHMNRAVQRTVGTVAGSALAYLLLSAEPSAVTVIAAICVLQIVTELVIGANYALGQVFVTPMALLMTALGAGRAEAAQMASERVLDTVVGAGLGLAVAVLLSTLEDRRALHHKRSGGELIG